MLSRKIIFPTLLVNSGKFKLDQNESYNVGNLRKMANETYIKFD